jgi:4,4'-diaponeurosporenoate glycosyltransferase
MISNLLTLIPLFFWLLLFLFLWKIPLALKKAQEPPTAMASDPTEPISVSIIIPARNEEKNLALLLDSLSRQSLKPLEIIVANDNSRDGTARVAEDRGARLINLKDLPEGWTGKALACFEGAKAAGGELLIFLDADTCLEADGLKLLLKLYEKHRGFISVQPFHRMERPEERLSAFFNLISFLSMNVSSLIRRLNRPNGAFGPCFICARRDYFAVGGHEAIKGEIIEDLALARLAQKKGYVVNCFAGRGVISFRMYPGGLSPLIEGWTKNFASGAVKVGPLMFLLSFGWVTGAMSGPVDIIKGLATQNNYLIKLGIVFYVIFTAQIYFFLQKLGNFGLFSAILYPVNLAFFIFIFLRSLVYTHVLGYVYWKERKFRLKKRT